MLSNFSGFDRHVTAWPNSTCPAQEIHAQGTLVRIPARNVGVQLPIKHNEDACADNDCGHQHDGS